MPKNFKKWYLIAFLVAIAIGFISTAIETTQNRFPELDKSLQDADAKSRALDRALKDLNKPEKSELSSKQLIIGKWRYMGTLERGNSTSLDGVIEYFEDNTYSQRLSAKGIFDEIENGEYIVLTLPGVEPRYV
jgi:hypothetical protein